VERWIALVVFSFVSAVTPGPNNILLWASGASFGLRPTLPHVAGTAIGIGIMALAAAAGLSALITAVPGLAIVMKLLGSAYLLYLAWQITKIGALERREAARPLSLIGAVAFQVVNPKAWVFALGAVTAFRLVDLSPQLGSLLIAATMMAVVVPVALLWAGAGDVLGRFITSPRSRRLVSLVLAGLLVLTIGLVWI
jgi:threonine/homoserine/homoserine lactone efflux protein